jgi:hypothetical protein
MDAVSFLIRRRLKLKVTDLGQGGLVWKRATAPELDEDERRLGFPLPPLFKRIYMDVGNGGFGPGYGLLGMSNGAPDDFGKTAPESYSLRRQGDPDNRDWFWPDALLPICHWGCAIYSCINCRDSNFPMQIFDPNVHQDSDWRDAYFDEAPSFDSWIREWAEGEDLWDDMYGDNGRIRKILAARKPIGVHPTQALLTPKKGPN